MVFRWVVFAALRAINVVLAEPINSMETAQTEITTWKTGRRRWTREAHASRSAYRNPLCA